MDDWTTDGFVDEPITNPHTDTMNNAIINHMRHELDESKATQAALQNALATMRQQLELSRQSSSARISKYEGTMSPLCADDKVWVIEVEHHFGICPYCKGSRVYADASTGGAALPCHYCGGIGSTASDITYIPVQCTVTRIKLTGHDNSVFDRMIEIKKSDGSLSRMVEQCRIKYNCLMRYECSNNGFYYSEHECSSACNVLHDEWVRTHKYLYQMHKKQTEV